MWEWSKVQEKGQIHLRRRRSNSLKKEKATALRSLRVKRAKSSNMRYNVLLACAGRERITTEGGRGPEGQRIEGLRMRLPAGDESLVRRSCCGKYTPSARHSAHTAAGVWRSRAGGHLLRDTFCAGDRKIADGRGMWNSVDEMF